MSGKGGLNVAGILLQVQNKKGNQKSRESYYEEQQAGNQGNMPGLWGQGIQNRYGLRNKVTNSIPIIQGEPTAGRAK